MTDKQKIKEGMLKEMTKDERGLLLYFEDVEVNSRSIVDMRKMNAVDFNIAKRWNKEGFVEFKRYSYKKGEQYVLTHRIVMSDDALRLAHQERFERVKRIRKVVNEK